MGAPCRSGNFFFLPPLAIARMGGSDTPLDCFVWDTDKSIHGGNQTVIKPAISLRVMANGSVRPFVPKVIQFRDGDLLRPVAPFFELWAIVEEGKRCKMLPVNLHLLKCFGAGIDSVEYRITVANREAQRRTLSAACAYIAQQVVSGDDHRRRQLLAFSPHVPGEEPLVSAEHKIRLGYFQVIRPIDRRAMGVDLSALRVRFTPATGEVYGPPTAVTGPASPLPPGQALDPVTLGGRLYEIVKPKNRILSSRTRWSEYVMDADSQEDPQPSDSYDGANVGDNRSWGVVDDSCDGIIEAQVAIGGDRYVATTRVLSSCPDFAPDRRPLNSLADDLADRDKEPVTMRTPEQLNEGLAEISDLFERAFETASLINLDANRYRGLNENLQSAKETKKPPHIGFDSMTGKDKPFADLTATFFPDRTETTKNLQFADLADLRHGELCDIEALLDLLQDQTKSEYLSDLIRPPFGRFTDLAKRNSGFRDPRVARDQLHDMRMPPYMRDSDAYPLSITRRQYDVLMKLLKEAPTLKSPVEHLAGNLAGREKPDDQRTDAAIERTKSSGRPKAGPSRTLVGRTSGSQS
jgi:hypothetical protein